MMSSNFILAFLLSLLVISLSFLPAVTVLTYKFTTKSEILYTEDVSQARQFQRKCLTKTNGVITVKTLIEAWVLKCTWDA